MSKRKKNKNEDCLDSEFKNIQYKRPKIKFENIPVVNNIQDLIDIGKTNKFYKNINMIMLWDILPYLEELNNMIGMKSLKETMFFQIIYYLQNMHKKNNNEYLHTVIYGNAGCGKTTVAKIIGNIYKNLGILSSNGVFKVANREDFVAEYVGQTAVKTKKLLKSCLGGILFLDEAYAMGPGKKDSDSFSKEAVDTLCGFLSEHKNDFCCIIAGYEKEIKNCFFSINPGLERRFPWIHSIEQYNNENLTDIYFKMLKETEWELDSTLDKNFFNKLFLNNKDLFTNSGGDIETFISKCKMIHSKRVFGLDKKFKFIINEEDIKNSLEMFKKHKLFNVEKPYYNPMYT